MIHKYTTDPYCWEHDWHDRESRYRNSQFWCKVEMNFDEPRELATLLEGAGWLFFPSAIIFQTFNILWCNRAVKLDFFFENVYISVSGVILCKKNGQSTSIFTEICKRNSVKNNSYVKSLPWLLKNENIQNLKNLKKNLEVQCECLFYDEDK